MSFFLLSDFNYPEVTYNRLKRRFEDGSHISPGGFVNNKLVAVSNQIYGGEGLFKDLLCDFFIFTLTIEQVFVINKILPSRYKNISIKKEKKSDLFAILAISN